MSPSSNQKKAFFGEHRGCQRGKPPGSETFLQQECRKTHWRRGVSGEDERIMIAERVNLGVPFGVVMGIYARQCDRRHRQGDAYRAENFGASLFEVLSFLMWVDGERRVDLERVVAWRMGLNLV